MLILAILVMSRRDFLICEYRDLLTEMEILNYICFFIFVFNFVLLFMFDCVCILRTGFYNIHMEVRE